MADSQASLYLKEHPEKRAVYNERSKKRYVLLRRDAMAKLGNTCACCAESESVFLSIDHINNDACIDRKNGIRGAYMILKKILNDPEADKHYQVLCYNCNMAKARNKGYCPHPSLK